MSERARIVERWLLWWAGAAMAAGYLPVYYSHAERRFTHLGTPAVA